MVILVFGCRHSKYPMSQARYQKQLSWCTLTHSETIKFWGTLFICQGMWKDNSANVDLQSAATPCENPYSNKYRIMYGLPWTPIFCHTWGESTMIFTCNSVTLNGLHYIPVWNDARLKFRLHVFRLSHKDSSVFWMIDLWCNAIFPYFSDSKYQRKLWHKYLDAVSN